MKAWMPFPTQWIRATGLKRFPWKRSGAGSDNIAALMCLIAISHIVDDVTGVARITYTDLHERTGLSRSKLSAGLKILKHKNLLETEGQARSHYHLRNYGQGGWGKMPVRTMYESGRITAFSGFNLRKRTELDALKVFLLIVAFRGEDINAAHIGYEKIVEHSGVHGNRIKAAISLLTNHELIVVDPRKKENELGYSHTYRIVGVESRKHMGTIGRKDD
jgi:DNA-binding transcriptional ArsR family regulator